MLRSKSMMLNNLYFTKESMWETLNNLAYIEKVMLEENKEEKISSQLSFYTTQINSRCEELFSILQEIESEIIKFRWKIKDYEKSPNEYLKNIDLYCEKQLKENSSYFDDVEKVIKRNFEKFERQKTNYEKLNKQRLEMFEKFEAINSLNELIPLEFQNKAIMSNDDRSFFGTIPTSNINRLRKIIFRISRENIIFRTLNLKQSKDELVEEFCGGMFDKIEKTLLVIVIPKTDTKKIFNQINSILNLNQFVAIDLFQKSEFLEDLENKLLENEKIVKKTKSEIEEILKNFTKAEVLLNLSNIKVFQLVIQREYNFSKIHLHLKEKKGFYQLSFWIPEESYRDLIEKFENIQKDNPHFTKPSIDDLDSAEEREILKNSKSPTFFECTNFTYPFQQIINIYGVPRYKEINPALFTIISFPFFFGIMFGDIGHGILLFSISVYLLSLKNNELNKITYLILIMAIFSIFCGFIYNHFFSIPLLVFPSCYNSENFEKKDKSCTYIFGIDWIWGKAQNESAFINSFKMKFSIIIGVLQMLLGLTLKAANGIHFSNYIDLFFEALPQFIFLLFTFGYMVFCIIYKWLINWENKNPISIIQIFINFTNVQQPLFDSLEVQQNLQLAIIVLCLCSIILMLFPKPILLWRKSKKGKDFGVLHSDVNFDVSEEEHKQEDFSELFVHQLIETIEFVLGSVSNTASYLRLWALSLAHGQLSKVFYEMIFGWTIKNSENIYVSVLVIIFGFVFFFLVSVAVVMCMSLMECFLHALRLHWVEFQNKFYKGDGREFKTFKHSTRESS